MNELVLIFTRDQLLNILTKLEVEQDKVGTPQVFRVAVSATPDGVGVEWGEVTLGIKPDEQEQEVSTP